MCRREDEVISFKPPAHASHVMQLGQQLAPRVQPRSYYAVPFWFKIIACVDSREVVGQRRFQLPTEINVGGLQHVANCWQWSCVWMGCSPFGLITSKLPIFCLHQ